MDKKTGIVYADVRGLLSKVIGRMNTDDDIHPSSNCHLHSLNRTLSEMRAALKDITLERTETLPQVPSIDLEELFPGWQSTSSKIHSSRQWSEIFRNASFGSSITTKPHHNLLHS